MSSRPEAAFLFAVVAKLALKRRLPTFLGGPFRGIKPIRSFDEVAVPADDPIKMPGEPFAGNNGQGVGVCRVVIVHAGLSHETANHSMRWKPY
jgi:hypothetical protein